MITSALTPVLTGTDGQVVEQFQVGLNLLDHAWATDLDHDLSSIRQGCRVRLSDGGRGQWRPLKSCKDLVWSGSQFVAQDLLNLFYRDRRGGILQLDQLDLVNGGTRSARVEIICPSLINIGPRSSSAIRTCSGCV